MKSEPWWKGDPLVHPCPYCGCPIQKGPNKDGMAKHIEMIHGGVASPAQTYRTRPNRHPVFTKEPK